MSVRRDGVVQTISEALNGHRNSFGAIRLALALLVIVSHSFPLGGWGTDPTSAWSGQAHIGTIAVIGFFGVSGYLVTKSAASADIVQFAWRRALRLMPAFWLALVVVAFLFGPVAWALEGRELGSYFSEANDGPLRYVVSNVTTFVSQWGIHDTFQTTTPFGRMEGNSAVNGSLWTLRHELLAYVVVGGLAAIGVLRHARVLVPLLAAFLAVLQIVNAASPGAAGQIFYVLGMSRVLPLLLAFFVGSTFAMYSRQIPMTTALGLGSAAIFFLTWWKGGLYTFGIPAFVYLLIWLASALPKRLQRIGNDGRPDLSYGVYLYGWPVQQFLAYLGLHKFGFLPFLLGSLALSTVFAFCSWYAVERPTLAMKDAGPGRGVAYWAARLRPGGRTASSVTDSP
jgi:peptidoglycan/LPS O-acetylase OafA/YrhL